MSTYENVFIIYISMFFFRRIQRNIKQNVWTTLSANYVVIPNWYPWLVLLAKTNLHLMYQCNQISFTMYKILPDTRQSTVRIIISRILTLISRIRTPFLVFYLSIHKSPSRKHISGVGQCALCLLFYGPVALSPNVYWTIYYSLRRW